MNGKTSGVHKRGLKQQQTTKFLKGILYIKKQQDWLFEHKKNNFFHCTSFATATKNVSRISSKVIPVYATKYLLQIGVGDTISVLRKLAHQNIFNDIS